MKSGLSVFALTLLLVAPLWPQNAQRSVDGIALEGILDWRQGTLQLVAETGLNPQARNAPANAHYQERVITRTMPALTQAALTPVYFDSSRTIGDVLAARPELVGRISEAVGDMKPSYSRVSRDLSTIEVTFLLELYPRILRALYTPGEPRPVPRVLDWQATDEFTGVVIFAQAPLPLRGESSTALLRPALLPDIMDTALNPVLTAEHVRPDVFESRGMVSYTTSLDPADWNDVVGPSPLRVLAREVFGTFPTDIILNRQDAARILSNDRNRQLLAEGRVLVIVSPEVARHNF